MNRTVWGFVRDAEGPLAVYYVTWTVGRVDHGAVFDVVVGQWGEGTSTNDRAVVAAAFQHLPSGPQFMIVDANGRPAARPGGLADTALPREQVINTPLATQVFAILDAVWLQDGRIDELRRSPR